MSGSSTQQRMKQDRAYFIKHLGGQWKSIEVHHRRGRIAVAMKDGFTIQMVWQVISMKVPFVWCQMRDRSNSYEKN